MTASEKEQKSCRECKHIKEKGFERACLLCDSSNNHAQFEPMVSIKLKEEKENG